MTNDIATVLEKMADSGKFTKKDKWWISHKLNEAHERELQYRLIDAFARNPELPYILGVAGGFGTGFLGSLISPKTEKDSDFGNTAEDVTRVWLEWITLGPTGTIGAEALRAVKEKIGSGSLETSVGGIFELAGYSFGSFCMSILLLKAAFGDGEGSPLTALMMGAV